MEPSLDPQLDNHKHINNPKVKEAVEKTIIELELTDIWRENNPQCKRYTWRKTTPSKQGRLVGFFVPLSDH